MNRALIVAARRFMAGWEGPEWGEVCTSCGLSVAAEKKAKLLASTFNQVDFFLFDSPFLCQKCHSVFASPDSRSKCLLWAEPGKKSLLPREAVLPLLADPPKSQFVLSVPYSFQKHHWLEAGLSQNGRAYVGTEDGCVCLDYNRHDIASIIALVLDMLTKGVPRKEVETGRYSTVTRARYGLSLDRWESALSPFRNAGAIRLFTIYAPVTKIKTVFTGEVKRVFSEHEKTAIKLLISLARSSAYRSTDGKRFWQGYFKARIIRYMMEDINSFYSQVANDISCQSAFLETDIIAELSEEDGKAVMEQIREKPDLMLAAVFSEMQESREAFRAQEKPARPLTRRSENDHFTLF